MTNCGDSVDSCPNVQRIKNKAKKRWSDQENRYLLAHRSDGFLLISEGLEGFGYHRSPDAVRVHAQRDLGITLAKYPESGMRKCVSCGQWDARPGTTAGNAGFCPTCWTRRKTRAYLEGGRERDAQREYEREKKRRRDERKRRRSQDRGKEEK